MAERILVVDSIDEYYEYLPKVGIDMVALFAPVDIDKTETKNLQKYVLQKAFEFKALNAKTPNDHKIPKDILPNQVLKAASYTRDLSLTLAGEAIPDEINSQSSYLRLFGVEPFENTPLHTDVLYKDKRASTPLYGCWFNITGIARLSLKSTFKSTPDDIFEEMEFYEDPLLPIGQRMLRKDKYDDFAHIDIPEMHIGTWSLGGLITNDIDIAPTLHQVESVKDSGTNPPRLSVNVF